MHVHVYTFYACACACVQNTFEFADVGTRLGVTRASTSENIADAHVSLHCESLEPVRTSCGCRPCGNVLFDLCGYVRGSAVPQRSAMRKYRNRRYGMHVHVRVFFLVVVVRAGFANDLSRPCNDRCFATVSPYTFASHQLCSVFGMAIFVPCFACLSYHTCH